MKKLVEKMKKLKNNQGNSFVVVVATVSFLAILTAALLVAVALIYRLRAYDINSRDNFYYLEQAMDELYAGIGADSMGILNEAYDDTLETLVYYDTEAKAYTTMNNEQANAILRKTYIYLLHNDENYNSTTKVETRLNSFLSNKYDASSNPEGVQLSFNTIQKNDEDLTIANLVLKRQAKYNTVNARAAGETEAGENFIQSITTDIVIGSPGFDINFNSNATELNELYEYSLIADMGVEITGPDGKAAVGDKVSLTGNLYAASDFYNKSYNDDPGTINWQGTAVDTIDGDQIQKVNSYSKDRLEECDGVNTKSMYSGLYVDGAQLTLASDRLVIPGTLAAMDCADVTIATISNASDTWTEIWADGIVLDGYSLKKNLDGDMRGSVLNMRANLFVYDDLEVNANSASVNLNGEYYGYNYASTDNRTYSDSALANGTRTFASHVNKSYKDGKQIEGQAHYNSSAIILNGENTNLDFSGVKTMYVAGQSYIELSKQTTKTEETMTYDVETTTGEGGVGTVTIEDKVAMESDSYAAQDDKNYSTSNNTTKTPIQDYRTGEAISVKSNQLAYIPNTNVVEDETGIYVNLPASLKTLDAYKDVWDDLSHVPVIKSVISGKTYYFYDFSKAKATASMNKFIEDYAKLFDIETITSGTDERTTGEKANLTNITDYEFFQVEALNVDTEGTTNIYTNSAITTKIGNKFTIKASQQNVEALTQAAARLSSENVNASAAATNASSLTEALNLQYKEAKWLLTNKSNKTDYVAEAHALAEDCITPINHFFDFSLLNEDNARYCALESGYGVWYSDGDVLVGADGYSFSLDGKNKKYYDTPFRKGKVRGIILAKGDVQFESDVYEFEGLIVAGGKIIVNNFTADKKTMALSANAEIIKSVLRECDASRGESADKNYGFVCDTFRLFESMYKEPTESDENEVTTMKDISSIQFEDIISLKNWVKNVD